METPAKPRPEVHHYDQKEKKRLDTQLQKHAGHPMFGGEGPSEEQDTKMRMKNLTTPLSLSTQRYKES